MQPALLSTAAGSLQSGTRILSDCQLIHAAFPDKLQILSLWSIERSVERSFPSKLRSRLAAFELPRHDKRPDSCFLNVDPRFGCWMQIEDQKNGLSIR